jgi:hypothetical protein
MEIFLVLVVMNLMLSKLIYHGQFLYVLASLWSQFLQQNLCVWVSTDLGGRLCNLCFNETDSSVRDCSVWVNDNKDQGCSICASISDKGFCCFLCDRFMCQACTEPITLNHFLSKDAYFLSCTSCFPNNARKIPDNVVDGTQFCVLCQCAHNITNGVVCCKLSSNDIPPLLELILNNKFEDCTHETDNGYNFDRIIGLMGTIFKFVIQNQFQKWRYIIRR